MTSKKDKKSGSPHGYIENISVLEKPVNLEASRQPSCQSKLTYAPVDIDLHKSVQLYLRVRESWNENHEQG